MEDISRKTMIKLSSLMHTGLTSRFCRIFGTHSWKQCNGEKTCGMWTMGHADQWPLTSLRSSELLHICFNGSIVTNIWTSFLSENLLGIFRYMWNSTGVEKSEYIGNLKILKYRILLFITTYYCPFFIPQGAIAFIITIFKDR